MKAKYEYKGYIAKVEYDETAEVLCGTVVNMLQDVVMFEATTPAKIMKEFKASVDFYLESCKKRGKDPESPQHYSGKISLRVEPEFHQELALAAHAQHTSMNKLIRTTLENQLLGAH